MPASSLSKLRTAARPSFMFRRTSRAKVAPAASRSSSSRQVCSTRPACTHILRETLLAMLLSPKGGHRIGWPLASASCKPPSTLASASCKVASICIALRAQSIELCVVDQCPLLAFFLRAVIACFVFCALGVGLLHMQRVSLRSMAVHLMECLSLFHTGAGSLV